HLHRALCAAPHGGAGRGPSDGLYGGRCRIASAGWQPAIHARTLWRVSRHARLARTLPERCEGAGSPAAAAARGSRVAISQPSLRTAPVPSIANEAATSASDLSKHEAERLLEKVWPAEIA